ncbi:hypothetical protein FVEG_17713 [Fusarium verticillioides 7600]|uniref:Uncharacterized protein n=1 Tax=Gibberella moniliformis (strain M3125 / FGSC 7600) TaxID=334819 RepID=W7MXX0_GIBM7|nr:hypothetical protein FVEG_17713 [Fusarium verticillioides 7600]EWG55948.1 hypothetical protein FVEG_17713 [Fusarium verticillioides 7600]
MLFSPDRLIPALYQKSRLAPVCGSKTSLQTIVSAQQLRIAELYADQNVVVSAKPGSGKIATIEAIAAAHPDKRIGSILFSKRLQSETSHRLRKYHNSDVYTFHGIAGLLLGQVVPSDEALIKLLENIDKCGKLPRWASKPFDIIFINRVFLGGEQYISSSKRGPKPIVLRCNIWDSLAVAGAISPLIKRYKPENCVIIARSIRTKGPLQDLTNALAQVYGLPINVPPDEETPLDDIVINGKLCISTIHQFKGRERKLVVLLGIDASYFQFFGRDLPDDS